MFTHGYAGVPGPCVNTLINTLYYHCWGYFSLNDIDFFLAYTYILELKERIQWPCPCSWHLQPRSIYLRHTPPYWNVTHVGKLMEVWSREVNNLKKGKNLDISFRTFQTFCFKSRDKRFCQMNTKIYIALVACTFPSIRKLILDSKFMKWLSYPELCTEKG